MPRPKDVMMGGIWREMRGASTVVCLVCGSETAPNYPRQEGNYPGGPLQRYQQPAVLYVELKFAAFVGK